MLKIYLSSTYVDLKAHRARVAHTLQRLGFETRAMELYFAMDERPLDMCLADVRQCDLYIGIFAWRYGFIPTDNNPDRVSITELEYREAGKKGIPRLIFISRDLPGDWPPSLVDSEEACKRLREAASVEFSVGKFQSVEDLAVEVSVAVNMWKEEARKGSNCAICTRS